MIRNLFLILFFIQAFLCRGQTVFFEKYPETENKIRETYNQLSILHTRGEEGKLIYAMAAPEVAVYDLFLDKIETKASEIFYVNLGGDYANFSLGMFQMKPLFAEKIEKIYLTLKITGKIDFSYTDTAASEIRYHRIKRLKNTEWQQKYLIACYEILNFKYAKKYTDTENKIRFYAAAYNYGFDAPEQEIKKWEKKISFPGRFDKPVVAYADLAFSVWEIISGEIKSDNLTETNKDRTEIVHQDSSKEIITVKKKKKAIHSPEQKLKSDSKINESAKFKPMIVTGILVMAVGFIFLFRSRRRKNH